MLYAVPAACRCRRWQRHSVSAIFTAHFLRRYHTSSATAGYMPVCRLQLSQPHPVTINLQEHQTNTPAVPRKRSSRVRLSSYPHLLQLLHSSIMKERFDQDFVVLTTHENENNSQVRFTPCQTIEWHMGHIQQGTKASASTGAKYSAKYLDRGWLLKPFPM